MKRFIFLVIVTAAITAGFLAARGMLPFNFYPVTDLEPLTSFFQGRAGLITAIAAPIALAVMLYSGEIFRFFSLLLLSIFAPAIDEEKRFNRTLNRQIEANEKRLNHTEQVLKEFTTAVSMYAKHLSSHTSAIQGLSGASQEMKKGEAVQSRFLDNLTKNTEERLVSKEALLATMRMNLTSTEAPAPETRESVVKKPRPSYKDLHPPVPEVEKPAAADNRSMLERANLVEAMVLPYYRALDELDSRKPPAEQTKMPAEAPEPTAEAKKAVESIMFPLYRTLYKADTDRPLSATKKSEESGSPARRKLSRPFPPGCARRYRPPQRS